MSRGVALARFPAALFLFSSRAQRGTHIEKRVASLDMDPSLLRDWKPVLVRRRSRLGRVLAVFLDGFVGRGVGLRVIFNFRDAGRIRHGGPGEKAGLDGIGRELLE